MRTNKTLIQVLQDLENKLNKVKTRDNLQYQAGYINSSVDGPYFYIKDIHHFDDAVIEGFFVTILQANGEIEYSDIPTNKQMLIVNKFRNKLFRQNRIGKNAQLRPKSIKLHPNVFGDYDDDVDYK